MNHSLIIVRWLSVCGGIKILLRLRLIDLRALVYHLSGCIKIRENCIILPHILRNKKFHVVEILFILLWMMHFWVIFKLRSFNILIFISIDDKKVIDSRRMAANLVFKFFIAESFFEKARLLKFLWDNGSSKKFCLFDSF